MSFYSLVPFEGDVYIIKAEESKPLETDQLEKIDSSIKEGKSVSEMQELLKDVWNS